MIDPPQIAQTQTQLTAIIPITVPRTEIMKVMGAGVQELMATVAAQGISPAGPWFTHHLRKPTDTFEFEISVPVSAPVAAAGRVKPSQWPAMKVVRTVYHGPYEGMGDAWGQFEAWISANGLRPAADLWECYLQGPESGPDATTYRTQLNRPLVG